MDMMGDERMRIYCHTATATGRLLLVSDGESLVRVDFPGTEPDPAWRRDRGDRVLAATCAQLADYFAGRRADFDLPLAPAGTPFQHSVWAALRRIPYGRTLSYAQLAEAIGRGGAARAVGHANGRNPIPIIIPCHRVVATGGKLGGYGGGLDRKRALLELEASASFKLTAA
jgi:methylated-DNA-[protein]-cysteine S-methyltransferase